MKWDIFIIAPVSKNPYPGRLLRVMVDVSWSRRTSNAATASTAGSAYKALLKYPVLQITPYGNDALTKEVGST